MGGLRSELTGAAASVRARPSLLVAGLASAVAWWATTLALGLAESTVEDVAGLVLIGSGRARQGFLGQRAPAATLDLVQVVLSLALAVVLLELCWFALVLPARAATVRVLRHGESWPAAVRSVVGRAGHLVAGGLVHRTVVVALFPVAALAAVAVYVSLGTGLEASAYALGVHPHWVVGPVGVLFSLAAGRRGAAAVAGSPVARLAASSPGGDGPTGFSAARNSPRRALSRPRETARSGALVGALVLLPLAVAVPAVVVLDRLSGSDLGGLAGFLAFAAVVTVTAVVAHTLAVVVDVDDPRDAGSAAGGDDPPGIRETVPWRRVALAALVLAGAGIAGGAVRVGDHRPVSAEGSVPGPVAESADPDRVVADGLAAVPRSSHTATVRAESRTLYANGTVGDWEPGIALRSRFDRPDGQVLVTARLTAPGEAGRYVTYFDGTVVVTGRVNATDLDPAPAAMREASLLAQPAHPGILGGNGLTGAAGLSSTDGAGGWTVLNRTGGRIHLESRVPGTVSAFSDGGVAPEVLVDGRVRATVSAETGRIRRVDVRYTRNHSSMDHPTEVHRTVVVEGYGTTEVDRPAGVGRTPVELVLDAVFY